MKSAWSERDAKAAVDRYGEQGVAPDLALRVYSTRLIGGDPQAGAARRRQYLAQRQSARSRRQRGRGALRQRLRLGHGRDRAGRLSGGAARRLARTCARARRCRDDDMARAQRAFLDRSAGAVAVGRDAAARLHAGEIRRPQPRDRGAQPDRPAERARACATRSMTAGSASCPI